MLPAAPVDLQVLRMVDNNVTLSWKPGFTGHSELSTCVVQVTQTLNRSAGSHLSPEEVIKQSPRPQVSRRSARRWNLPQQEVQVPPHLLVLSGLRSHSNYSVRVSCVNEVGASPFSPWFHFLTHESGESVRSALSSGSVSFTAPSIQFDSGLIPEPERGC